MSEASKIRRELGDYDFSHVDVDWDEVSKEVDALAKEFGDWSAGDLPVTERPSKSNEEAKSTGLSAETKQPEDLGDRTVRFRASTDSPDRDGDTVVPKGIQTQRYADNPVALFAHKQRGIPVGKTVRWEKRQGEFVVDIKFDEDDFADLIYQKVKSGSLNAVSIGFIPLEHTEKDEEEGGGFVFDRVELLEISIVTVPSNPEAIALERAVSKAFDGDENKRGSRHNRTDVNRLKSIREQNMRAAIEADEMLADGGEESALGLDDTLGGFVGDAEEDEHEDAFDVTLEKLSDADQTEVEAIIEAQRARLDELQEMLRAEDILTSTRKERMAEIIRSSVEAYRRIERLVDLPSDTQRDVEAEGEKDVEEKTVTEFIDLPLAPRNREWDSDAADGRWRSFTGSEDEPSGDYWRNFFWYDPENRQNFGAYKLPYGDVPDDSHVAVPRGIFGSAAAVQGARGGVDVPEDEMPDIRSHIESYYEKMRDEFDDDRLIPPWNSEDSIEVWFTRNAKALQYDTLVTAAVDIANMMKDVGVKEPFDRTAELCSLSVRNIKEASGVTEDEENKDLIPISLKSED